MRFLFYCLIFIAFNIAIADSETEKYSAIVQRNAFNLRTPEPPKPPEPPPPSVTVKLTGITTILSSKRALLVVQEQGKPSETKMLREGEKEGPVEVVAIDEVAGTVKIINSGKEMTLSFEKDGIKPPTAPAVPTPVPVAQPGRIPPLPGAIIPGTQPTATIPAPGNIPVRINPTATPTLPGINQPQPAATTPGASLPSSGYTRPVRLPGAKN